MSKGGLNVPKLEGEIAEELKARLFPGAAVGNPIDILATGTPEHLRLCIDYCEEKLDNIDAMMAIFGTPGLVTMFEMYDVLHEKMQTCKKPFSLYFLRLIRRSGGCRLPGKRTREFCR